jgi:peptide/nickel transport system ATP-binding protein
MALLEVRDLHVSFRTLDGVVRAAEGVSYALERGRTLGLVGESGSGKSVSGLTIMGLTRGENASITGEIDFDGRELLRLPGSELRRIRGRRIAMIFQDPLSSLHPYYQVGAQIVEAIRTHESLSREEARRRAGEALEAVGIPGRRVDDYPHELSGGMRQRAMLAMAFALRPDVLIADEPTTALDVTVQRQVLELIRSLRDELGMAVLLISHDLGVIEETADEVAVMYAGRVVEQAPKDTIFEAPQHPYTWGLLDSIPRLDIRRGERLRPMAAAEPRPPTARLQVLPPLPVSAGAGGRARTRARRSRSRPPRSLPPPARGAAAAPPRAVARTGTRRMNAAAGTGRPERNGAPLLVSPELDTLSPGRRFAIGRSREPVHAVDGITFSVHRGETLGLVGESGSGKSTTARLVTRLLEPTSGRIAYDGRDVTHWPQRRLRPLRAEVQVIFQDPYSSLTPRRTVGAIVAEPLRTLGLADETARRARVREVMDRVGLNPEHYNRYPHEFSGGQRQRIGIARAIVQNPKLIVADEPVSALDVSIQAQVLNLLQDLRDELDLTLLFISHDLVVVRHVSDRVAVMHEGKIVEIADADGLYEHPAHPYTRELLAAVPGTSAPPR